MWCRMPKRSRISMSRTSAFGSPMENFFSFRRCGPDHHTVNFRTGDKNFMHHIAFELKDWAHLGLAGETLGQHKRPILWGPLRHGIGHKLAIYHRRILCGARTDEERGAGLFRTAALARGSPAAAESLEAGGWRRHGP